VSPVERNARAYCLKLGLNPNEIVFGTLEGRAGWCSAPRWCWYQGARA